MIEAERPRGYEQLHSKPVSTVTRDDVAGRTSPHLSKRDVCTSKHRPHFAVTPVPSLNGPDPLGRRGVAPPRTDACPVYKKHARRLASAGRFYETHVRPRQARVQVVGPEATSLT